MSQASRRGRPRDAAADTRIRGAAADLLLERGFERVTVQDVAERAGVGKATVYRRWPSKEALAYDALAGLIGVELATQDTGSLVGDLAPAVEDLAGFAATPRGAGFLALAAREAARDPRLTRLYREALDRWIDRARGPFQRAAARGEIRTDVDPRAVVESLLGVLVLRALTGAPLPDAVELRAQVELLLDGLRPR
ncbi:TetR/AcrR family transcriptional regulator [Actinopolymorpha alba]|uniref:TetR/AcrR family transcriptional regulator n=1 Tax=Actinopolymorpha alba TaxID=533267 RepID=UPI00037712DE|nr:TetR/AcrR family transcriptional regulator [Actinopolymorpha alba]